MKNKCFALLLLSLIISFGCTHKKQNLFDTQPGLSEWPAEMPWWKANNLRLIQTNLPAYEAGLNVDSLIADLQYFSANVLLINAGGIMAFLSICPATILKTTTRVYIAALTKTKMIKKGFSTIAMGFHCQLKKIGKIRFFESTTNSNPIQ